ncbi:unnamed protein product [Mesocestoides corti]|uniref:BACK domain-containing protein n=1 Tax=Mesocestoides corti TaxID=53468 RepID=A0A0R3U8Q4_MESCO|nr:unnamed protein product [Mesocestoides corti]
MHALPRWAHASQNPEAAVASRLMVSRENVEQIWSVANATKNTLMIDICVPVIAAHFDSITADATFHSTTELDNLLSLLSDDRLVGVAEAAKLRTVAMWFEANNTATKEDVTAFVDEDDDTRVSTFKDLVGAINLSQITSDEFIEFCMSDCWINLQREFRFGFAVDVQALVICAWLHCSVFSFTPTGT